MTLTADDVTYRVPDPPSVGGSVRSALTDFYFNSWRLVPANVVWGAGVLGAVLLLSVFPLGALLVIIALALPGAGIFRLATLIARGESVSFSDALDAWRRYFRRALLVGAVLVGMTLVLSLNVILALTTNEPILWVIGTLAGWTLLATWVIALPFWALLTDPVREGEPLRDLLRLAAMLTLISPLRFLVLFLLTLVVLVVSTIFFAALVTISVAFIALLAVRYTLPAADRLEQRQTQSVSG